MRVRTEMRQWLWDVHNWCAWVLEYTDGLTITQEPEAMGLDQIDKGGDILLMMPVRGREN